MASSLFTSGFAFAALCAGCAVAGDSAKIAPVLNQPKLVVGEVGPLISGTGPHPIPPEHAGACEQLVELANMTRAKGELFYSVSEPYREIVPPDWKPLDYRKHKELIVQGLYNGWCDEADRVTENGEPFSDALRTECRERSFKDTREWLRGDAKLERARVDINRDGDVEWLYQFLIDPRIVVTEVSPAIRVDMLIPKIFVSPTEDGETFLQLHKTMFAPSSTLFTWRGNLYAMRGWGYIDEYQLDEVVSISGVLAQGRVCKLKPDGGADDQREGASGR